MKDFIQAYLTKHGFGFFRPKAVLFDMDGVIYDSMAKHAISWHSSMASFGLDIALDGAYRYEGMRGVETIKLLARQQWHRELTDEEAENMYKVKSEYFTQLPATQKMKGIMPLMQKIHESGLTIGIVTGSGQHTLIDQLTTAFHGLISPEHIVTSYDVKHGKPQPDPYIIGMEKCGILPYETIVVENAPLGIQAAVAAHCFTIAVNTGPLPNEELKIAGADIVLPSIIKLNRLWPKIYQDTQDTKKVQKQEDRWEEHFEEIRTYIQKYHRQPSKHRVSEHKMLNWMKYNRKLLNAGELSAERKMKFRELMELASQFHHVNQYDRKD